MIEPKKIALLQDLKRNGLSDRAMANRMGMDRKSVRKLLDRHLAAATCMQQSCVPIVSQIRSGMSRTGIAAAILFEQSS